MSIHEEAEKIYSFLNWWYEASSVLRGELCRKVACRGMSQQGLLPEQRRYLINCGKVLRGNRISSGQEHELLKILKRMAQTWPDFSWPQKERPEHRFPRVTASPSAPADLSLFPWQEEAFQAWLSAGKRGIIKAVTGSGKTLVALAAIRSCLRENGRAAVVVPTTALLLQWKSQLREKLGIPDEQIGLGGGGYRCRPLRQAVTVWVLNSARKHLSHAFGESPGQNPVLLVVDECHRAGSRENAKLFCAPYNQAMGLSATPERHGDPGYERILLPALGEAIFHYDFTRALAEGTIPPFDLINMGVDFSPWERGEYDRQTVVIQRKLQILMLQNRHLRWHLCRNYYAQGCYRHFSRLGAICPSCHRFEPWQNPGDSPQFFKFLHYLVEYEDNPFARQIMHLLLRRKRLVTDARARLPMALEVLKRCSENSQVLVFLERIAAAEELSRSLAESRPGVRLGLYHSLMPGDARESALMDFLQERLQCLISCRALDEGLDVPSVHLGVIVSSTSSVRQRVQRLGRILRTHPGKSRSSVVNIYVRETSERQLMFREFQSEKMDKVIGFFDPPAGGENQFLDEYFVP
ncbi:MAG: DEAD/DEAH box helicase [Armatimonadetes bacterium]|nr:DEAD/DEAH box helicase [Armatimonadota bacterium]